MSKFHPSICGKKDLLMLRYDAKVLIDNAG